MRKVALIFIALVLLMMDSCSCNKKASASKQKKANQALTKPAKHDTLVYVYKSLGGKSDSCKNARGCNYSSATFPIFKNDSLLNDTINKIVGSNYHGEEVDELASDSIEQGEPMTFDVNIIVKPQKLNFLALEVYLESSGGVHPNSSTEYINWDTKNNKIISIKDLLLNDDDSRLTDIAEQIFRKDENLNENASLENYFFKDGVFSLNGNFQITPEGLSFFYNSYEIKPYMAGTTTLLVPYSKIKSLLKPNTVLAQYIK